MPILISVLICCLCRLPVGFMFSHLSRIPGQSHFSLLELHEFCVMCEKMRCRRVGSVKQHYLPRFSPCSAWPSCEDTSHALFSRSWHRRHVLLVETHPHLLGLNPNVTSSESPSLLVLFYIPWWLRGQSIHLQCGRPGFDPWGGKTPWRRKLQPTPVFLPGKCHGGRSLVGYSPWGRKESDTTE